MSGWDEKDDGQPTPVSETRNGERPIGDGDTLVFGVEASPAPEFGFDYAGFEEALDHISREEQAAKPEPTKVADAPVERQTLPRRVHPDDVTHTIRPVGKFSYVTMQGRVNEGFDGEALGQQLRGNAVIFDLAEVDRITSFGVRGWLRMLQTANLGEAYFVRCSESVVNQITMIHNFCGPARVHSLVAPYLCASCGAEFGVVYDAVRDATVLRGRRPPEVLCPECSAAAEMDEDPWAFFDLDQQLLESVPEDLTKALELVSTEPRHAPIEKFVSGGTTRIAFNGEITDKTRFHRPLSGIEGVVIIDLVHVERVVGAGYPRLLDALEQVAGDVRQFRLEGVTAELGSLLLDRRPAKVAVATLKLPASNHAGIRRDVVIDVVANRGSLLQMRGPRVDAAWAQSGIQLDDPALARDLVDALGYFPADPTPAPAPHQGTPQPAPPQTAYPGQPAYPQQVLYATPGPAPMAGQAYGGTPAPIMFTYAAPPQAPAPAPAPSMAPRLILGATIGFAMLAMTVIVVAVGIFATSMARRDAEQTEAAAAAAAAAAAPEKVEDGAWSTGGTTRPAWAASPVMQSDTQLLLLGEGRASDAQSARDQARQAALLHLAQYAYSQITASPTAPGLSGFPLPDDASVVATALQGGATPLPLTAEVQAATRTIDGDEEVIVQYAVDKVALGNYLATFVTPWDFRGLKVAESPPWSPRAVRLVATTTWWPVPVGAKLKSVAGAPPTTAAGFPEQAEAAYNALEAGADALIVFTDGTKDHTVTVSKRPAQNPKAPKLELMKKEGR